MPANPGLGEIEWCDNVEAFCRLSWRPLSFMAIGKIAALVGLPNCKADKCRNRAEGE
jgi:hypothetical protein